METIFISSKIITLSSPLLVMQRGCMFINEIIVELWSNLRQRNMDNGPWHQPHWQPQEDPCYRCETIATAACWQCPNVMCSRHSFGYDGVHLRCGACHLRSIPADEEEEVSEQSESNDEPENENNHDDYEGEEEEVSEQSQSSDEPESENNHDSDEGSLPMSFPEPSFEDPPAPHEPDDPERTSMANTPESTTIIDRPVSGHCFWCDDRACHICRNHSECGNSMCSRHAQEIEAIQGHNIFCDQCGASVAWRNVGHADDVNL